MSCSMTRRLASELVAEAQEERAEHLDLALGDAGGRLVEADQPRAAGDDARQLEDPARARRQLVDELVGDLAEIERVEQLIGLGAAATLGAARCGADRPSRSPDRPGGAGPTPPVPSRGP